MGFFSSSIKTKVEKAGLSKELLYKHECSLCTLNSVVNRNPKLLPTGSKEPLILILGEANGEDEDIKGEQFVGVSGQLLRPLIPEKFSPWIRWDNTVRCRPPKNRPPTDLELACCRPRHISDVETTQPFAIFGFGNIPLSWAIGQIGITKWRGRYLPIKVGNHTCWYFPFIHPSSLLRQRKVNSKGRTVPSDDEFATELDLERAFKLVEQLPDPVVHTEQDAKLGVTCITGKDKGDLQEVIKFLAYASTKKYAGFDYETQNLRPYEKTSKILTIAVAIEGESLAFAFEHPQAGWTQSQLELVRQAFVDFLLSPCHKVVHNLAFEQEWTAFFFGKDKLRSTDWDDTILQAFVLDERPNSFNLDFLCLQYFGFSLKAISKQLDRIHLENENLEDVLIYNAMDAKYHRLLFLEQQKRIVKDNLQHVYELQLRRIPTIVLTQMKGIPIDFEVNKQLKLKFQKQIDDVLKEIQDQDEVKTFKNLLAREFNPGSTRDVEVLLDKVLNTRIGLKETGRYSTDEEILSKIDKLITRLIIEYRKATKALSTYVEPYDPESERTTVHDDGLVHTSYNTIFTATGRLSSDNPNLQNIPKRNTGLKEVRTQFVPR